ncbi:MAG: hypothetical protein NTW62_00020 [Candidatus Nomurabacteria bacterium]|nr:hypothetical protein [Candidatus Nomurabacteria bacterium]
MAKTLNKILLNKKEGETPLEALEFFRAKNKIYKNLPMTYAGRLDPMAEGLMIILTGEECKNKEKYLNFDKEYEFQVLFGFTTDTYDILGKVINIRHGVYFKNKDILEKEIKKIFKEFLGKRKQKYPIYSSKTVNGQPLFSYARSGENVEIPEREVEIKSLKLIKIQSIKKEKLLRDIEKRINKVKGDFRQKEIIKIWKRNLNSPKTASSFWTASFKVKCSSGTYVRSISNEMGEKLGIPSLAFSIKRTKIGKYSLK